MRRTLQFVNRGDMGSLARSAGLRHDRAWSFAIETSRGQPRRQSAVVLAGHVDDQRRTASRKLAPICRLAAGRLMRAEKHDCGRDAAMG